MALFSELAQAMNLMYGLNKTHETNQYDEFEISCSNNDYMVSDYNTFSQALSDPLPESYESEPSDIDFVKPGYS